MVRFTDAAVKLAGFAGALLGWRPGEFWEATPAELEAVVTAMIGEGGVALNLGEFEGLMRMFPDSPSTTGYAGGPPPRAGED